MRRQPIALGLLGSAAVAAGCSVLNAFDDVRPLDGHDAGYSFTTTADASAPPSGDASPDAQASNGAVMVVAGEIDESADSGVELARIGMLAVLDPLTGHEIGVREKMTVSGVAHDPVSDLWYLFESSGNFVAGPTDTMTLHVRALDATGKWTEKQKLTVPVLENYDLVAVTNSRLTYVAYAEGDSGVAGNLELVTFDTSAPAALQKIDHQSIASSLAALPSAPLALTGTPATAGPGGRVSLYRKRSCAFPICTLEVVSYLVPNSTNPPAPADVPEALENFSAFGRPAVATTQCPNPADLVLYPRAVGADAGPPTYDTFRYDPFSVPAGTTIGSPVSVSPFKGGFLRRLAVDDIDRIVFAVETNTDLQLHAVSLLTGQSVAVDTSHSGQSVYYEPASKTVFAPFNQGNGKDFTAFRVGVDPNTGPTLTRRTTGDWDPPPDLRPNLLGVRKPLTVACK